MTINTRLALATRGLRGGQGINREIFNFERFNPVVNETPVQTGYSAVQITGSGQPVQTITSRQTATQVKVSANTTSITWESE